MENLTTTVQSIGDISPLLNPPVDPMSYDDVFLFRKITLTFWLSLSVAGIFTNVINMHTFIRMGLDDSVTISFFALAICDFFNCSLMFLEILGIIWEILEVDLELWVSIKPSVPTIYIDVIRKGFATIAILVTTYLAVQRCLCVLIPFHVKGMFTKFKTYCFLAVCFLVCFIPLSLYLSRYQVVLVPHYAFFNTSQLGLTILPNSEPYFYITDVLLGIVFNFGGQIIVVLCLIFIFVSLKKSLRFRQATKANVGLSEDNADGKDNPNNAKEMQALKQVGLISLIFVCTNSPYFALVLARLFIPGFGLYEIYHNLFLFVYVPIFITEMIGSTINVVVYYKYNTKFRSVCVLAPKSMNLH